MRTESDRPAGTRAALVALALVAAVLLAFPLAASAGSRTHAPGAAGAVSASASAAQAQRVLDYWTPQRMREARPLDLVVDGSGQPRLHVGAPSPAAA
ncbi:MAG TPA: hypothetical protein VHR18_07300, partial [Solirubrobacterales bacterium]|nr:hypothetical protein [Solirubrobacterales bacterium]